MRITRETVREERDRIRGREGVPALINDVRDRLERQFDTTVEHVSLGDYRAEVDAVFADGDRAVNVAGLAAILRELDCEGDYPGFIVDEILGRRLAATIAGGEPLGTLAEATFHVADLQVHGDETEAAGADDLDAALAAGFQTRLPGWSWRAGESPFALGE